MKPELSQLNPNDIKTKKVQLWQNGIMITAQIDNRDARNMVSNGFAFVITSQAIGAIRDGEMWS